MEMPGVVTVVTCLQLTKAAHVRLPAVSRAVPDAWSQPLEAVRRQQVCPGCRKSGLPVTLLCSGCAWVVTVWRALHPGTNQLPVPTGQGGDTPGDTVVDTGGLALPTVACTVVFRAAHLARGGHPDTAGLSVQDRCVDISGCVRGRTAVGSMLVQLGRGLLF